MLATSSASRGLLANHAYRRLIGSLAVSRAGDFLYNTALVVVVLQRTGSAGWVAGGARRPAPSVHGAHAVGRRPRGPDGPAPAHGPVRRRPLRAHARRRARRGRAGAGLDPPAGRHPHHRRGVAVHVGARREHPRGRPRGPARARERRHQRGRVRGRGRGAAARCPRAVGGSRRPALRVERGVVRAVRAAAVRDPRAAAPAGRRRGGRVVLAGHCAGAGRPARGAVGSGHHARHGRGDVHLRRRARTHAAGQSRPVGYGRVGAGPARRGRRHRRRPGHGRGGAPRPQRPAPRPSSAWGRSGVGSR